MCRNHVTKTQCIGMIRQSIDPGNNLDVEGQRVADDDGVAENGTEEIEIQRQQ